MHSKVEHLLHRTHKPAFYRAGFVFYILLSTVASLTLLSLQGSAATPAIVASSNQPVASSTQPEEILVRMPHHQTLKLPGLDWNFSDATDGVNQVSPESLEQLSKYISTHREILGAVGNLSFDLRLLTQARLGKKIYIRYQQLVKRRVGPHEYSIAIEGANVVGTIIDHKLVRLNSHLMTPDSLGPSFKNPGFDIQLNDTEMGSLMTTIKSSDSALINLRTYLDSIARRGRRNFSFEEFLNRQIPEQRQILNEFLGNLGRVSTARIIIDLGRANKLSLVKYGNTWMMQVTEFLGLPVQFDIEIPKLSSEVEQSKPEKLKIKNLRDLFCGNADVKGYKSPHFPGGKKEENGPGSEFAISKFQQIVQYFNDYFSWPGYSGKTPTPSIVEVHTQLKSIDFRENAAWFGSIKKFLVGEGGNQIYHLDQSLSVLGHEYSHALIQFSSGIVYKGQSGALNEHFADIQGASIESTLNNNNIFKFTIGSDVLTPSLRAEKEKMLNLILPAYNYKPEEFLQYGLDQIGLRHLYAPALSFATQIDSMELAQQRYSSDCQPSSSVNDNCGVHTLSGIPNKAVSYIIQNLGFEQTRKMIFNTLVYRLQPTANFEDYAEQMQEECLSQPELASRCSIVAAGFQKVGIKATLKTEDTLKLLPPITLPVVNPPPVTPPAVTAVAAAEAGTSAQQASTPELRVCGALQRDLENKIFAIRQGDLEIYLFTGPLEFQVKISDSNLESLKKFESACVYGEATQFVTLKNNVASAFIKVNRVDPQTNTETYQKLESMSPTNSLSHTLNGAHQSETKNVNFGEVIDLRGGKDGHFCGWISVNSKTQDIKLIDNRYNLTLIALNPSNPQNSPTDLGSTLTSRTSGDFTSLYTNECACVDGTLDIGKNELNQDFYYLRELKNDHSIEIRESKDCHGIRWK